MIHIFDVDYTLIRKSTAYYFLLEAVVQKRISLKQLGNLPLDWLRYKFGAIHFDFIEKAVSHMAGIDESAIDEVAENCFEHRLRYNIYQEAERLIRQIQDEGGEAVLATSSFYNLIRPLERFLGVKESIASRLEFENGKTTGRIDGKALFGANKKEAVEEWLKKRSITLQDLCFYSDSYTDIPLLSAVGRPVAVNPDRFLRRKACQDNWCILQFRELPSRSDRSRLF
ncbi:MAG: HAD-IB family hydrolase [Treponema sp.]|jgi:HAD superfamily hydrolase (TIGR01490 family)|nr:HAD-IB family hydrolase [Treponema sp.]